MHVQLVSEDFQQKVLHKLANGSFEATDIELTSCGFKPKLYKRLHDPKLGFAGCGYWGRVY